MRKRDMKKIVEMCAIDYLHTVVGKGMLTDAGRDGIAIFALGWLFGRRLDDAMLPTQQVDFIQAVIKEVTL